MKKFPIYCINLKHRKDRKKHSLKEFKKLGLSSDKIIYPNFIKDKRGGVYGCYESHIYIWNNFFKKYPDNKYCLIFEDDFIINNNTNIILKKATKFIDKNYNNIDMLFLHNLKLHVDNKLNNKYFTNGYGLCMHSYFITRNYIQSLITKYNKIPKPNGYHIDFNINIDYNNSIHSNKLFFTNIECVKQIVDNSDNYLNWFDKLFRKDINVQVNNVIKIFLFIKKIKLMNTKQIKTLLIFVGKYLI